MLGEQYSAKFCKGVRSDIVERPQDALAIIDGERDDSSLERERLLEKRARWLIHEPYELADIGVGNLQAREVHRGEGTP